MFICILIANFFVFRYIRNVLGNFRNVLPESKRTQYFYVSHVAEKSKDIFHSTTLPTEDLYVYTAYLIDLIIRESHDHLDRDAAAHNLYAQYMMKGLFILGDSRSVV